MRMEVDGDGGMLPRILDSNPGKTVLRKELSTRHPKGPRRTSRSTTAR
jgi:hypothetical protein